MLPGYYIVTKNLILSNRIRLQHGDWVVTDGDILGRFDKEMLDWVPVVGLRGDLVHLSDIELDNAVIKIPLSRLREEFEKLVFTDVGDPLPDMPVPSSLSQLGNYLKARRVLLAHLSSLLG